MLQSYSAQLQGNQIVWIDAAPAPLSQPRRILVVLDDAVDGASSQSVGDVLRHARGALGHASRETVLAQLAQLRQQWE